MNAEINAVILAGGKGSRMGDITKEEQKCILPVDGKPILSYILDNLDNVFSKVNLTIAIGHMGENVRNLYGDSYKNIKIKYVHQPEYLETKKRLLTTENLVNGSFLCMPGDVITHPMLLDEIFNNYIKDSKKNNLMGVMSAASDHAPALTHGLITAEENKVVDLTFPASKEWKINQYRDMTIAYYNSNFFSLLKKGSENKTFISQIISQALKEGVNFNVCTYFEKWHHFAYDKDLKKSIDFSHTPKELAYI